MNTFFFAEAKKSDCLQLTQAAGGLVPACPFCGFSGNVQVVDASSADTFFYATQCPRCGTRGPLGRTREAAAQGWTARLTPLPPGDDENVHPFLEAPVRGSSRPGDPRHWPFRVPEAATLAGRTALEAVRNICRRQDERMRLDRKPLCVNLTICARSLPDVIRAVEGALETLQEWAGESPYGKDVRADMASGGMLSRSFGARFTYALAAAGRPFRKKPTTKS